MKKILIALFCLFFFLPQPLVAASKPTVTLSDAIYADLAVNHYLDNVSIYYSSGKSIDDIRLNETRHWLPASTVKTFVAMYVYKLVSLGTIHLFDNVTIDEKNEVPTELVDNPLPALTAGENVRIDALTRQMIIQSDNTAFNQLLDVLGRDNITNYIQNLGLTHSHVGSKLNLDESQTQYEYDIPGYGINTTTAEDYAKAFLLIKNNKIPGARDLYSILKDQKINNMIPFFLPKDVICAHKTGDLDPLYHDGGICQDKKHSYILTIFTNAGDPSLIAHLSQIIYTKNFNLVGQNPDKPTIGKSKQQLDPLVMTTPLKNVLGATTMNFPIPDITAADLGVKASDLSLAINSNDLPPVIIPADSPLHPLSDVWQVVKVLFAPGPNARLEVNMENGKLRLAEANDLALRGKMQEAQDIMNTIHSGLTLLAKDPTVATNPVAQNTIVAISETRFSILSNTLLNTSGDQKLTVIKQIATQAKQTIQDINPYIPEAINATNPSQKPLIGEVVSTSDSGIIVKTAGGQEITIPTNSSIEIKGNLNPMPYTSENPTEVTSGSDSSRPSVYPGRSGIRSLAVGTTVALIGSNIRNTFAPSLVIPNVPRELVAPQPVIVAKVAKDYIVVEENGVYTQVNVNKDTAIKAADTNISLSEIKSGDVIIVHGQPLTPIINNAPSPSSIPSGIPTLFPTITTIAPTVFQNNLNTTPTSIPTTFSQPKNTPTIQTQNPPAPTTQVTPPAGRGGTSIQIIEKKNDIPTTQQKTPPSPTASPQIKQKEEHQVTPTP